MAYRSDVEALHARHAALDAEILERSRLRDEVARMLAEARAREASDAYVADLAAGGPARRRRQRLIRIALAAATTLVVAVAVVGIRAARRHPSNHEAVYQMLSVFTDQMCACTTPACANDVAERLSKWGMEMAKQDQSGGQDMSEQEMKRFAQLSERMSTCMQAAMMTTPPPVDHVEN